MLPVGEAVEDVYIHPTADLAVIELKLPVEGAISAELGDSVDDGEDLLINRYDDFTLDAHLLL